MVLRYDSARKLIQLYSVIVTNQSRERGVATVSRHLHKDLRRQGGSHAYVWGKQQKPWAAVSSLFWRNPKKPKCWRVAEDKVREITDQILEGLMGQG